MGSRLIAMTVACSVVGVGCSREPEAPAAPPAPTTPAGQSFTAVRGGFVPEGIEYDRANARFLSGSIREGTIFILGRDGSVTPFVTDPALKATAGIEADEPRDRLLVASSDAVVLRDQAALGQAFLNVYNLTTGERLAAVDLGALGDLGRHFANDVAVDGDGNAYVTDTLSNVIYKVTPDYQASVLYRFTGLAADARVNGIEYHPNGYLLVVLGSLMFKVPVASPTSASQVNIAPPMPGEGLVWAADGTLAVTGAQQAVKLRSTDDWATAHQAGVAQLVGPATTAAAVGDEIWAVHPHFADAEPPSVEQAVFK